ncbi:phage antirepressor N-terminal domain-containing protein [Pseudomonas sp. NPDC098747]|uniref:phage antirepressor N-terminal domain-containing protein n=1 Tax=Pseudomonas sp. NPDC098747 TaxID=3364487 RepID=UPI00383B34CB
MKHQLMPVPFYEDTVVLIGKNNDPFVAMKPVVENLGLAWQSQHVKLTEKFGTNITEIVTVAEDGKTRGMVCLPLRKLPAWLYSISPNKVKPELHDKIVRYQEECDDALWDYWTKKSVTRSGVPNVTQQIALSRHRIALLKELQRTRNHAIRATIQEEVIQLSVQLSLSAPNMDDIGVAEPPQPEILADFWAALRHLDEKGIKYNHAIKSTLLAFRFEDLANLFKKHGINIKLDDVLIRALKSSTAPRYINHNSSLYSGIERTTMRCWVFEALPSIFNG